MSLKGISEKIMNDGTTAIMVRFQYQSVTYPIKNFTSLFGCRTKTQAKNKLIEVKSLIAEGKNPFVNSSSTLNIIWENRVDYFTKDKKWNDKTIKVYVAFYDNYLRKPIGSKKIEKITYEELLKIKHSMSGSGPKLKNTIRKILSPIYVEYMKSGVVRENQAKKLDNETEETDKDIALRSSESALEILKKLYNAVEYLQTKNKSQKIEIHMFLYLMIFTAHRRGELIKLKKEHLVLEENKIIAPIELTKTKIKSHFPIPPVCLEYFKNIDDGLLFPTFSYKSIFEVFQRLVGISGISLYEGEHITPHDIRRLMTSVMVSKKCKIDSALADTCLSHKEKGTQKSYLKFSYEDISDAFSKYWDAIVLDDEEYDEKYNPTVEKKVGNTESLDNTDKLFKLADLFEKGLLTKDEFIEQKNLILK